MSENHLSELAFRELELPDAIRKGIDDADFEYCTPIQSRTLPIALEGRDVAGQAQTGTGKTAAFLIALFNRLLASERPDSKQSAPRAVILAPTRELAVQIAADAETLGRHTGLELALAYGGKDYDKQRDQIAAGIDVLVGTPGRLIDYFKQGVFNLKHVEVMVLDEADRMFDLGFIKDIRYVLRRLPPPTERLNMLDRKSTRLNPVTPENLVCRLLLEQKNNLVLLGYEIGGQITAIKLHNLNNIQ